MDNCCGENRGMRAAAGGTHALAQRFPDSQELPKLRWRQALAALAGPAVRMHRFRSLRTAMLYDALSRDQDCRSS
jgi:hypothetical protein